MKAENSRTRGLPWLLSIGAAAMLGLALVLMFLLALATNNQTRFEQYYERLVYVNMGVAALLLLGLAWVAYRLVSRVRRGRFGSRLLLKLAAIFALVGFLPGVLIYGVSYQFVSRSIESWFNVQVEGALDAGLALGRNTIESQANDLLAKTRVAAQQLADTELAGPVTLERIREQLGASDVILWSGGGQLLASAGESRYSLAPDKPSPAQLRQVRASRGISSVEGLEEAASGQATTGESAANTTPRARIKAMAAVSAGALSLSLNSALSSEQRVLQVTQALPAGLVANALAVQEAYRQYQERALARNGLRNMYIGTLTLSLFLAMFAAVLLAVVLGNQIARPLLVLADGVAQVAAGDLTPKAALQTRDELGGLTRSFAQMTQQLSDARAQVHTSLMALDASRTNLQTILDNLTAGVIVLDTDGIVLQANPGATRVLRAPLAAFIDKPLATVPGLEHFALQVSEQFKAFFGEQEAHSAEHWQHSFELAAPGAALEDAALRMSGQDSATSIIARGAALPGNQRLLVFDDITEIVSAQRARAWGEVARRLAHEIKNPLTPIQLSAERLEMKLQGKLAGSEEALLTKSVKTIVDQVDAMKRLVNEFRDYARLPSADLKPLNLSELINDVLSLYAPENAAVPVCAELDSECPLIKGDAQQLRQVIHNLLQNAQDATLARHEADLLEPQASSGQPPCVRITLRYNAASQRVRMRVSDEGAGFAPHILQRAFEPYVTTKTKGTGLGLAVVKKIADEHGARIELASRVEETADLAVEESETEKTLSTFVLGAQVSVYFPVV
jgi:nitrogen fixation/metabolism regulation signal transduction histidine kinase